MNRRTIIQGLAALAVVPIALPAQARSLSGTILVATHPVGVPFSVLINITAKPGFMYDGVPAGFMREYDKLFANNPSIRPWLDGDVSVYMRDAVHNHWAADGYAPEAAIHLRLRNHGSKYEDHHDLTSVDVIFSAIQV